MVDINYIPGQDSPQQEGQPNTFNSDESDLPRFGTKMKNEIEATDESQFPKPDMTEEEKAQFLKTKKHNDAIKILSQFEEENQLYLHFS